MNTEHEPNVDWTEPQPFTPDQLAAALGLVNERPDGRTAALDAAREVLETHSLWGERPAGTPECYQASQEHIAAARRNALALARAVLRVEALADRLESAATGSLADPSAGTWTIEQANAEHEMARRIRTTLNGDDHE